MKPAFLFTLPLLGGTIASACSAQAPAAPATGALTPQTQAEAMATCRASLIRQGYRAKDVPAACAENWRKLNAAMPMARAIIALMSQPPASARTAAGAKAALAGVKWHIRSDPPERPRTLSFDGDLGNLRVNLGGRGAVDEVTFAWADTGGASPFDLPAALKFRGLKLSPLACGTGGDAFGDSTTTAFRAEMPGATPFRLDVNARDAALEMQQGWYTVTVYPGAPLPTLAGLRAAHPGTDPVEAVQWQQCR